MRALIIDGDKTFNQGLAFFLKGRGLAVDSAWTGADGADMAKYYDYDIILTDIMLPDMMGHDIIKRLRGTGITTPVMIVSNMAAIPTKLDCFGCGADDYVLKSCDKYEIFARVQAIVRRSHGAAESVITVGQMQVNLESKMVTVGGRPLHLTGKEYAILELLCLRRGMTVSKEQFLNHLYGGRPSFILLRLILAWAQGPPLCMCIFYPGWIVAQASRRLTGSTTTQQG